MPKAYWIAHIDVHDPQGYKDYVAKSTAAVQAFGGRHIVRGGKSEAREGQMRSRHAVVEFPSYDVAVACYQSDLYQEALGIRNRYSQGDLSIVEGVDAT
jgi:uncharacterized protein (DUF1330 family)